eukprot:GFUD01072374.1.p1 GENE.GFUD01072374.1~~GFUD01072374.1.p1  ORF type:complete len:2138 (-),score=539.44 GFUD01072374.1:426-6839(-)
MGRQSGDRLSSYISVADTPPAEQREPPPPRVIRRASVREPTPPRLLRERTPLRDSPPRMDRDEMSPITQASSPAKKRLMPSRPSAAKQANIDKQTIDILKSTVASLRSQMVQTKEVAENERLAVRSLRRERHADIKAAREEETKKYDCLLAELKNRSEHEKNIAVAAKSDQLERKFQTEFTKFANIKEEEIRRMRAEERRTRDDLIQQLRETQRASAVVSPCTSPKGSLDRFHHRDPENVASGQVQPPDRAPRPPDKHSQELGVLRTHKKKLEEIIQVAHESDRKKLEEMRQMKETQDAELKEIKKIAKTEILKLMDEVRGKDRAIVELESQVKKLAESGHKNLLREEAARDKWINAKERRHSARIGNLQEKLHQTQESAVVREQNLGQEIRGIREEKERELNFTREEARSKEEELSRKLSKLTEEYDKLKSNMVRKLSEAEQSIGPLKSKNRQFVSRNLELSARNKQLQDTLRELTVQYNKEKEHEQNIDPDVRSLRSTRSRNKEKRAQRKAIQNVGTRSSQNLEAADYQNLYTHLQKEYTELQRAYQLLQTRIVPSGQDVEREEKNITYLKNKLQAAETKITDLESCLNQIDHSATTKKLIDDKQAVINLNLGLSEKIRVLEEREGRLRSELQDSKDQAELLEFRVLELEECQEKTQPSQVRDMKQTVDTGTETDTDLIDSGCSSIQHSRCPSVATDEDIAEIQRDFRNEKIHETQLKLHALVGHVQGPTSKSLLLQTVALFEALLTRIKELQQENRKLKDICGMNSIEQEDKAPNAGANDDLVLEIEKLNQEKIALKQELKEAQALIQYYKQNYEKLTQDLKERETDLEKKEEVHRKLSDMQSKVEGDLKKQVNCLNQKLDTTIVGCRSESEMHEESLLKVSMLDRSIMGFKQCIDDLQSENNELREQLSAALEHHTTKSSGSLGSEFGSTKASSLLSDISDSGTQKTGSSGIGSDLSDSEADHLSLRSRSASPEKSLTGERFSESGIFETTNFVNSQTQTTDQYIKEIASLTDEVEKLTAFRDLVETKMILPIPSSAAEQRKISSKQCVVLNDKETTPVNETESNEEDIRSEIQDLLKTLEDTRSELRQVIEDKCELEEAENDSRLRAQVSEQEALDLHDSIKNLEDELLVERKAIKHLRSELETRKEKEDSSYNEIAYLELLTKQYEEKINMLEDSKEGLVNGLNLLVKGVTIWSFIHHNKFCIVKTLNRGLCFVPDNVYNLKQTDGLLNKIRRTDSLSTEDEPFSKKMRISCDDELKREKEELQLEVLKLKIEKEQFEKSQEKTYEEKIERIMTLEDKVAELFHEGKLMKDQFQKEKVSLKNIHERELDEFIKKDNNNNGRLNYLQNIVDVIENELENVNANGDKDISQKVKFLIDNESKLMKEITEHEKKEYAFRETLAEADVIMANIEYNYTSKVKDLEEENSCLQQRISYHTETEQRLKQSLKASGKNDSQSYGELLERLMETEKAELSMKEKVYYLEKSERELNLKLLEEQKMTSDLKNEIKDQEDLMAQMESMDSENKRLNQNMNRLKEIEFKYQEIQQSEDFLHGRVEELEQTEISLRETISVIEQTSAVKEKKMQEQIGRLREEVQHQNHSASNYEDAYDRLRGQDDSLKMEIDNLKEKVTELTCELNQKSTQFQETESSLRSELNKARQNLQQTNNQLTEIDTINCQLRGNLSHAEQQVQEKNSQVDQLKHHLEQTNIQHSLQLQAKENVLQNIQDKFERVRRKSDEKELDEIARSEGGLLAVTKEVEDAALTVSECVSCSPVLTSKLKDAAAQLSCLSTVICGQGEESRKMQGLGELHRCESEEVLPLHDEFEPTFELECSENQELTEMEESMLESQLSELQEKLERMEAEMTIVSEESKDLQDNLESREAEIVEKSQQLLDLTELVEHLTQNTEQEKQRADKILKQMQTECERLHEKDKYLNVFVETVVPACTLPNQNILAALKETQPAGTLPICDFTLESLCTAILNGRASSKKLVSDAEMKKIEELKNTSRDFRERSPISRPEINLTLLPPEEFRITRRVGSDGLLVAWKTPEDDEVTGYLIYVGGRLVQRVRSASRTKALLHGLHLENNLSIVLHATNSGDELSDPVEVVYTSSMVLPDQKQKRWGKVNQVENGDKVI